MADISKLTEYGYRNLALAQEYELGDYYNAELGNYSFTDSELRKNITKIKKLLQISVNHKSRFVLLFEDEYADKKCWFIVERNDL